MAFETARLRFLLVAALCSTIANSFLLSPTKSPSILSPSLSSSSLSWQNNRKMLPSSAKSAMPLSTLQLGRPSFRYVGVIRRMGLDDDEEDDYDDDDENNPLGKGVNSVSWLPSLVGAKDVQNPKITVPDAEFLPLFPLGGIVYTPNSEHVLNIFEPRYRQMYSDILMTGSKRFVVSMSHPTDSGRFARMGVLFELQELTEVSEHTNDQIKYICNHKVTGRVKLHRILNPTAWKTRATYLRVEGTIYDDSGKGKEGQAMDEELSKDVYGTIAAAAAAAADTEVTRLQNAVRDAFATLVQVQHELAEDVRFTRGSVATLAVQDGPGPTGLWATISLWQTFADQRLMARQNELQKEFQQRLQAFLKKERGLKEDELPIAIGFNELSADLQQELKQLQKRMALELRPLVLESTLTMQKILEAENHKARLKLLRCFIEAETRRLNTKRALKGMFSGSSGGGSAASAFPPEERLDEPKPQSSSSSQPASLLTDDEDAWQ